MPAPNLNDYNIFNICPNAAKRSDFFRHVSGNNLVRYVAFG